MKEMTQMALFKSKWLVIALTLSVAINILIAGFVIGRSGANRAEALDPTAGYYRLMRSWPEERRAAFEPMMQMHMRGMREHFKALQPAHAAVYAALQAEPFDAQALKAALQQLRSHLHASQIETHESLIEIAAAMSPEERHRLAGKLQAPRKHRSRNSLRSGKFPDAAKRNGRREE